MTTEEEFEKRSNKKGKATKAFPNCPVIDSCPLVISKGCTSTSVSTLNEFQFATSKSREDNSN